MLSVRSEPSGSVKRVGAAIGEGAAVVAQLHTFFSRRDSTAASARRAEAARSAARSALGGAVTHTHVDG